jgi:DNA replication protein DnaC/transposase
MIDPDRRKAIYQLHLAGTSQGQISRQFHVSPRTVRTIIRQQGALPQTVRKDKIHVDPELLRRLYRECGGWLQRVHERLVEEEKVQVSYPTLTRRARELGLGQPVSARCAHVPDEPGVEMQHDTTVYQVELGGQRTRVIASLLYLRYSKRRYLKFYRVFNRFAMKCFLHEALMFWGYAARQCVIDNTNLARLRGSGKQAVIVPEMVAFAARYGFTFLCHALRHPNRKAGEERSFWIVETNFLPGRSFQSLEDLNQQAREWATVRLEHRPQSKARLIPAKAFEHECHALTKLPAHWDQLLSEAHRGRFSHERLLKHVLEAEYRLKLEHARQLRRKRAHIPELLEIETFPFARQPKLDRQRVMALYDRFDYLTKKQNIVWLGPTGCGKSGLATAFLLQALDRGYRGYFITFPELVAELYASLADRSEQQALRKYARYDCLVIDEVGYVEIEPAQVGLFFTLMQKRHKTKTTLITSNLGFSEWGTLLKNNQLTGALLNRLTETSHVINMKDCRGLRPKLDETSESDAG